MDVELRHLRSFVAVVEELSFTRAAERLHLAQQAVSTHVRQLEQRVGVVLLVRDTRSVSLTPAGATLYEKARLLLADADDAVAAARASGSPPTRLTVGFVAPLDHRATGDGLDRFREDRPDVDLAVHFGNLLDPTGGLRERTTDVAFVYGPFDTSGLVLVPIYDEPLGIAMASQHPLGVRESLSVSDLVAEPTFDFPTPDVAWRDYWSAASYRDDPPRYVAQYRTLDGLVAALRGGLGVHLATKSLVDSVGDGVVWRPLRDVEPLRHCLAHRADDERPLVRDFVDTIVATVAATSHAD